MRVELQRAFSPVSASISRSVGRGRGAKAEDQLPLPGRRVRRAAPGARVSAGQDPGVRREVSNICIECGMIGEEERTQILRSDMVESQIRARGVRDEKVFRAMLSVPRHLFMPGHSHEAAYADHSMPIGHGQTISQSYIVAVMTQILAGPRVTGKSSRSERGRGTRRPSCPASSRTWSPSRGSTRSPWKRATGCRISDTKNIKVVTGDGTLGHPSDAPYGAVMVTAAAPRVPSALQQQLGDGGVLVVPVGSRYLQHSSRSWCERGTGSSGRRPTGACSCSL